MFSSKSDIVSLLCEDHERLRALMAKFKSAKDMGAKREIFADFLPLLEAHTFGEEETLIARALADKRLRPHAVEGLEEHDLAEFEVDKVLKAATDEQWEARVKVIAELLEHHLDEEEKDFFPLAQKVLSAEEREELATRYMDAREKLKLAPIIQLPIRKSALQEQSGRLGLVVAWLLGVPAWLLLMVFLVGGT